MTAKGKLSAKKKKAPKLTPAERAARRVKAEHIRTVRSIMRNVGFDRVPEVAGQDVEFSSQKGEFDDCFVYENVILLVEYTTSQPSNVSDHLKHKKILFDAVAGNQNGFLSYLFEKFPAFKERLAENYHIDRYRIRIVYCSRYDFDSAAKAVVTTPSYLDFPILKYFEKIAGAIKLSALPEVLQFCCIDPSEVGEGGVIKPVESAVSYPGSILPEEASGFPKGYKVVSFYADADALLRRAFVLRRKGWRGSQEAYQRMVIPSKIEAIRTGLKNRGQVAINNIIATLPSDVMPVGGDGHTIKFEELTETKPVKISLPIRSNSIGLIDGQHRLYSYYKTKDDDSKIAKLRHQQNLLVTGIIYPPELDTNEAERFEARLFLTINSNQASAPAELRQEIEVLLDPFSPIAISKQVMERLSSSGPLFGHVEKYFYDKGKLKTSSIVSFGLVPLLKTQGTDTLFNYFDKSKQRALLDGSVNALNEYIQMAASRIDMFLGAVRANVSANRWTTDRKEKRRLLTTTFINAFLITMRMLAEAGQDADFAALKDNLSGFDTFDTKPYSSSQYNRMAAQMAKKYFSV